MRGEERALFLLAIIEHLLCAGRVWIVIAERDLKEQGVAGQIG